ncbi:MAG TPA: hypothetical protein VF283_22135 [Bryobacteraceae bacterium]
MLHNFRFALRQIARAPGFAALACITLAVGIGIGAAMFAVIQSTLLQLLSATKR